MKPLGSLLRWGTSLVIEGTCRDSCRAHCHPPLQAATSTCRGSTEVRAAVQVEGQSPHISPHANNPLCTPWDGNHLLAVAFYLLGLSEMAEGVYHPNTPPLYQDQVQVLRWVTS